MFFQEIDEGLWFYLRDRALVPVPGSQPVYNRGFDLLTALYSDVSSVTGVEVNGATLDILRRVYAEYFRHWVRDPRVTLVEDDGRHVLASSVGTFDVIQLSGVDSYAGTPGSAHVFSESFLYTAEAFEAAGDAP